MKGRRDPAAPGHLLTECRGLPPATALVEKRPAPDRPALARVKGPGRAAGPALLWKRHTAPARTTCVKGPGRACGEKAE